MVYLYEQPIYQPFPNYNSYVAELVNGAIYVPIKDMINRTRVPEFMLYIDTLLAEIQIKKLTAVICLIYCERLKNRLPSDAKGTSDTIHRIFTASLLLACKYTTEPYNNRAVSKASKIYSIRDINNMEFEFLTLIDYEIWITKEDICSFMTENSEGLYIIGELN